MFSAFKRAIPQVSIFHNPASPPSQAALRLLNSALSSPYPASSGKPLVFNLEVVENKPPTSDQLRVILSYVHPESTPTPESPEVFLSSHPASDVRPNNLQDVVNLAQTNKNILKWPIVVDWDDGKAAVGDVEGVKSILEQLRKKRDGEAKEADVEHKPKGWFS
ncbi:unnamed protein product [Somion occarium]|uniref:Thioredoxin-like protein n=1 Tax=Somion occarium TaxID=3059160 RepID=A0ABP1E5N6_9APHY